MPLSLSGGMGLPAFPKRRASASWNPGMLTDALWLDSRSLTAGSTVASWADSAGNYPPMTQPTSGLQPLAFAASGGDPARVTWDGVDDYVSNTPGVATNPIDYTVIALHRCSDAAPSWQTILSTSVDSGVNGGVLLGFGSGGSLTMLGEINAGTTGEVTGIDIGADKSGPWLCSSIVYTGGNVTVRNTPFGGAVLTGVIPRAWEPEASTKLMVGRHFYGSSGLIYHGDIAQIIWAPSALSSDDVGRGENYLMSLVPDWGGGLGGGS